MDEDGRRALPGKFAFPGLSQSQETTEWLWNCEFSAVAADSPAFECTREWFALHIPEVEVLTALPLAPAEHKWGLHPIVLAGWGTPIGELFDLEALSALCKQLNRWSFFVTSVPLNYSGAVASPPNAVAVF